DAIACEAPPVEERRLRYQLSRSICARIARGLHAAPVSGRAVEPVSGPRRGKARAPFGVRASLGRGCIRAVTEEVARPSGAWQASREFFCGDRKKIAGGRPGGKNPHSGGGRVGWSVR